LQIAAAPFGSYAGTHEKSLRDHSDSAHWSIEAATARGRSPSLEKCWSNLADPVAKPYVDPMSAAEIIRESQTLTQQEKIAVMRQWLAGFGRGDKQRVTIERLLRRLEHPEVSEEIWDGFEQCEDGNAIEIDDEHFVNPPA
jgi:hypothetical protein